MKDKKPGQQKPEFHLLSPTSARTAEGLAAFYERLTGKKATAEEIEWARRKPAALGPQEPADSRPMRETSRKGGFVIVGIGKPPRKPKS